MIEIFDKILTKLNEAINRTEVIKQQLADKDAEIAQLQQQVAEKDVFIADLQKQIDDNNAEQLRQLEDALARLEEVLNA